jgi:FkbM family methyltransferase
MLFPNIRRILGICSPMSSLKLILAVGTSSRPKYRGVLLRLLQPFMRDGEFELRYQCYERVNKTTIRSSDMQADCLSTIELCILDTYEVERDFRPDLVIDGGGNIGLFTLRAAASILPGRKTPVKFVICEPLPKNIVQIRKHLEMNEIDAELMPFCLGGTRRSVPFYCRAANESGFDSNVPYDSVIDIPVITLQDAIGSSTAERILIKLDIEGMEMEVLEAYLPTERRAVYIVGELHHYPINAAILELMFHEHGWTVEMFEVGVEESNFRACSPAAAPLLQWPAAVKISAPVVAQMGSR